MRNNYIIMLFCALLLGCSINTISYKPQSRNISVIKDSIRVYADILITPYNGKLKNKLQYHWYASGALGENFGGYNGYLLNGGYKKLNLNGNLLEQGGFYNGLKDGIWKYWYPNGNLLKVEGWSKGVISKKILNYNQDGGQIESDTSLEKSQSDSTKVKTSWYNKIFKRTKKDSK